jgi:hypothetical protein
MDNEGLAVDFVFPAGNEGTAQNRSPRRNGLGRCHCGSDRYTLANEMKADKQSGMPASRMYECTNCGKYRLG